MSPEEVDARCRHLRMWICVRVDSIIENFTAERLTEESLLEKFYWRTFTGENLLRWRSFTEEIFWRNFTGEVLLRKFYWRNFTGEVLLRKFYWGSFTGEVLVRKFYRA